MLYEVSDDVLKLNPEFARLLADKGQPASKYHNVRAEAKGLTFQSGHEAAGVASLILLEEQRQIFALRLQVRFPLQGENIYVADAAYLDEKLRAHIVDFKGIKTREFKIKAKLFKEKYHQEIELL